MSAKYPINDKNLLELLHKYPFLRYRNVWTHEQCYHGKSRNLEHNYYTYWDGSGWENLWKNKYLPRLFKEYDSLSKADKKRFGFLQVKEKFGKLRIYCTGYGNGHLENIAEWLSGYICEYCGKEPRAKDGKRIVWTTDGWITHLCEDCAREHILKNTKGEISEVDIQKYLDEMKEIQEQPFVYKRTDKDKVTTVIYKETEDGWLVKDKEIVEDRTT